MYHKIDIGYIITFINTQQTGQGNSESSYIRENIGWKCRLWGNENKKVTEMNEGNN